MDNLKNDILKLLAYCQAHDWAGYDPYDALNSEIFKGLPFLDFRLFRLVFTQVMKRLPFNLRPLLLLPKTQNPKAIALFLMSLLKLLKLGLLEQKDLIKYMVERLVAFRSPNTPYWCWGYSFPWQTRTIIVPRGAPNLVCTTFVANALLDAYETTQEFNYLQMAVSSAEYILNDLYWIEGDSVAGFSYPLPSSRARIHNANLLGSALLCRVYKCSGDTRFIEPALRVARYSAAKQHDDGSWDYGELSTQRWVDNFHTGYNLCALQSISQYVDTSEFNPHIHHGFKFYRTHFFGKEGAPKYFHNRLFPIDIHCVAQSIITLQVLQSLGKDSVELVHSVLKWAMTNMWDARGFFYYQVLPLYTVRIPYMRWSQAWMLLALCTLMEGDDDRIFPRAQL